LRRSRALRAAARTDAFGAFSPARITWPGFPDVPFCADRASALWNRFTVSIGYALTPGWANDDFGSLLTPFAVDGDRGLGATPGG